MPSRENILVVDDEPGMCRLLQAVLGEAGYRVVAHQSAADALKALERERFDLVISDVRMPRATGVDVLRSVKEKSPDTPVILVSAFGSTKTAVEAMKLGTSDFIAKPFRNEEIRLAVEAVLERRRLAAENDALRREPAPQEGLGSMAGVSASMKEAFRAITGAAFSDVPVLFVGEAGTGRGLAARTLHLAGPRAPAPFVPVDCGGQGEGEAVAMLAGAFEGVFAGRAPARSGALAAAHRGTLYLRDVERLPAQAQALLARFLADGRVRRPGALESQAVDVRVAASASSVEEAARLLRPDLLRRLSACPVALPPLRERPEDVEPLASLFCARAGKRLGRPALRLSAEAVQLLRAAPWPGNVAELEAAVEAACRRSEGFLVEAADLRPRSGPPRLRPFREMKQELIESFERSYLETLMKECEGNVSRAAALADMDRKNLYELLKKHGLPARAD
jgi:DNA-binding NtrC family response regulator